jgi:hypothetical protein
LNSLFVTIPPEGEPFKDRCEVDGEQLRVDEVLEDLLPESSFSRSKAISVGGMFMLAAMTSVSVSKDSREM